MARPLHPEEIAERKAGWNRIWRERFLDSVCMLPANIQGQVHELMKASFKAGTDVGAKEARAGSTGRNRLMQSAISQKH